MVLLCKNLWKETLVSCLIYLPPNIPSITIRTSRDYFVVVSRCIKACTRSPISPVHRVFQYLSPIPRISEAIWGIWPLFGDLSSPRRWTFFRVSARSLRSKDWIFLVSGGPDPFLSNVSIENTVPLGLFPSLDSRIPFCVSLFAIFL